MFVYFWMSAMSQLNPMDIGDPAFADYDMNGMISFAEAFDYASWCDYIYSGLESPQYTDDPEGIGDYMFLGHRFWGDPIAVPFDDLYPWVIVDRYRGR